MAALLAHPCAGNGRGWVKYDSSRKARSLKCGDAYSAVRSTIAASVASRHRRQTAIGAAISHSAAWVPSTTPAAPNLAAAGCRGEAASGS